jgi:toxin ParE1/3/4
MSAPDRRVVFTPDARADFTSILLHSADQWGDRQRDIYAERLTSAIHDLARFPHLGPAREDLSPGLRSHRVEQHVVFYRVGNDTITITRILHRKMDAAKHLRQPRP